MDNTVLMHKDQRYCQGVEYFSEQAPWVTYYQGADLGTQNSSFQAAGKSSMYVAHYALVSRMNRGLDG